MKGPINENNQHDVWLYMGRAAIIVGMALAGCNVTDHPPDSPHAWEIHCNENHTRFYFLNWHGDPSLIYDSMEEARRDMLEKKAWSDAYNAGYRAKEVVPEKTEDLSKWKVCPYAK
jgi:hypothetical protein